MCLDFQVKSIARSLSLSGYLPFYEPELTANRGYTLSTNATK